MYVCMYICMYVLYVCTVCMCICMLWRTSALASSVCGRCMFISSQSKSALYGVQAHSKTAYVNICMYVCMYVDIKYRWIETSSMENLNSMRHDRHLMQRWLPIEQHLYVCMYVCMYVCFYEVLRDVHVCNAYHVIVYHVSLYNIPHTQVHRRPLFVRIQ
jgi:hypothetical protein